MVLWGATTGQSQNKILTAGFQFKPIVPTNLTNTGPTTIFENNIEYGIDPQMAYSFGMVIRRGFTKYLSFETGINYVTRNYNYSVFDAERQIDIQNSFRIIGYEIPTLGLVYVKLGEQIYMNGAFGLSFDVFPSDIGSGDTLFSVLAARNSWLQTALLANTGWEYRTEKNGYFYLGFSYHRPFTFMSRLQFSYDTPAAVERVQTDLLGNYFTVDFRYFFHEDPMKKKPVQVKKKTRRQKIKEFERMKKESGK